MKINASGIYVKIFSTSLLYLTMKKALQLAHKIYNFAYKLLYTLVYYFLSPFFFFLLLFQQPINYEDPDKFCLLFVLFCFS